jgi:hypothetical protein
MTRLVMANQCVPAAMIPMGVIEKRAISAYARVAD